MIFHILNRVNARARTCTKHSDYAAFERVIKETMACKPIRILGYLIMPRGNDFALVTDMAVDPFATYRLSGWIRTENVLAAGGLGALINIHDFDSTTSPVLIQLFFRVAIPAALGPVSRLD
jgi:hypothetical protein